VSEAKKRVDEDEIYRRIGLYVVVFQALENQLVQLTGFASNPDDQLHGQHQLAGLFFKTLTERAEASVNAFVDRWAPHRPDFKQRVEALLVRCRELARHRNVVVHSTYVFLEGGGELAGILRSDMVKGDGGIDFDQEMLGPESFAQAMKQIADVAFELGICRVQLIGWYRPAKDT
jgi:hypothetical protein